MIENSDPFTALRNEAREADKSLERQLASLEFLVAGIREDRHISDSAAFSNKDGFAGVTTNSHAYAATNGGLELDKAQQRFDQAFYELESGLRNLEKIVITMQDANCGNLQTSKHIERFQSILQERRQSLHHITNEFRRRKERLQLLSALAEKPDRHVEETGVHLLIREQDAIRHTAARVDEIISQTAMTQNRLRAQRETFTRMGGKLLQIAERVPTIKTVLSRINSRRKREAVVLGSLISFCFFFIVLFM